MSHRKSTAAVNLKEDSHIHTHLCNHASGEMEEYVLAAIDMGLESIVFLEHLETGINYFERTWLTEEDFTYYLDEGRRLQDAYSGRIRILLGVEVGYNPAAAGRLREWLNSHPWDRIGLSYHFLFDGTRHLNMVSRRKGNIEALEALGPESVLTRYFDDLIRAAQEIDCHMICHLDAAMRHSQGLRFQPSHWEQVETLLQLMHEKGIMLELNTSGFPLRGEPFPCRSIVIRAMELGIPLVAGSDAHSPAQVGRSFERLPSFLSR